MLLNKIINKLRGIYLDVYFNFNNKILFKDKYGLSYYLYKNTRPKDTFNIGVRTDDTTVLYAIEKILSSSNTTNSDSIHCIDVGSFIGVITLMMSKILKVNNKESLRGAIDLGIAMQLTNIARDVCEDSKRNRRYIKSDFSSIKETIYDSEIFYQKSFKSISSISIRSQFSVIVARRIYKKIGDYILKQKNIENYNKAGKIYVPLFEKVIQTFLSIFDFVKLSFVKDLIYDNHSNHNILEQEINLNERI